MIQLPQHVNRKELAEKLGLSISTIDRLRKNDPDFPKGVKLSKRSIRFRLKDVKEYLDSRN